MKRMALLFTLCTAQPVWGEALCILCPDPAEKPTTLSAGVAAVDGVDPWRGSRLPWIDDNPYPQVELDYRRDGSDGRRLDAHLAVESDTDYVWEMLGGRQDGWTADLRTRGYGIRDAGGAGTPYDTRLDDNLVLPRLWTPGQTTDLMPDLDAALQPLNVGVDRRDTDLGLRSRVASHWHLNARLRERKVEGVRATGGVIGSNYLNGRAVILPAPVDQTTRDFEIGGDYSRDLDSLSLALRFSEFRNDDDRLSWDNPYSSVSRAPRGAIALAPDNQFLQFDLSGVHRFSPASQLSFQVAYGQASQDQTFEPYTVNAALATEPLPRNSLNGERISWVAAARLAHQFANELSLDIDYHFEDLDNSTDPGLYSPVIGDFREPLPTARRNLGYDFNRHRLAARLAYPLTTGTRLQGGVDLSRTDRSDRAVDRADDLAVWGKIQWRFLAASSLSLRAEGGSRRGDDYAVVAETQPPQNPLLRKFDLADQDRWNIQATASHPLSGRLTLGAQIRAGQIDYPDSRIGLSDTDESSLSLDLSYSRNGDWSANLFTSYDRFESRQYGSAAFAEADWQTEIEDSAFSVGGSFNWHPVEGRWEHALELSLVDGQSDISVNNNPFPEVAADLLRFVYRGSYEFDDALSAAFELWCERYEEDDWAVQDVNPDTVARVLSFGEDVRDHDAVVAVLALRYRF